MWNCMLVWIEGNIYNLLDADMHKLPRTNWILVEDSLHHAEGYSMAVATRQPKDAYLLAAVFDR
jgi:hypothetical protein